MRMTTAPSIRPKPLMEARYAGAYYFRAADRRVVSVNTGAEARLIILLSGRYLADPRKGSALEPIDAAAGDVVLWRAGEERLETNDPTHPVYCLVILLDLDGIPAHLPRQVHDSRGLIRRLGETLVELRTESPALRAATETGYLAGLLAEYIRLAHLKKDELAYRVSRYIEDHITEPIRLADLARHVGLQQHHFARKYRAHTGRTPLDEVRRIRADFARGMLGEKRKWTLTQIARHVGLADAAQVSKLIKRYIGIPVRDLRSR